MEKAEAKAKTQEDKINMLIKSPTRDKITLPIQKTLNAQLNPPETPLGGSVDINMIHIKNLGSQLRQKCSKKKPKMKWNEFGENEWQIIETSLKQ